MTKRPQRSAFSLIELMIVIALMTILAGVVVPSSEGTVYDKLQSAAQVVAADVAYARSLAVTNNSTYQLSFNKTQNRYVLTHTGSVTSLNTLPPSPFRAASDPSNQQITDLDDLPQLAAAVTLWEVQAMSTSPSRVNNVEFSSLGETTRTSDTFVWLAAGSSSERRYLSVSINHVTGLTEIGEFQALGPPAASGAALP